MQHGRSSGVEKMYLVGSQDQQIILRADEDIFPGAGYEGGGELL